MRTYSLNFFHWMVTGLPQLVALAPRLNADPSLHILLYGQSFMLEQATLLGIPSAQVIEYDPCALYFGSEVFRVRRSADAGILELPSSETLRRTRRAVLGALSGLPARQNVHEHSGKSVIFFSRRDKMRSSSYQRGVHAKQRHIVNEDAVIGILKRTFEPNPLGLRVDVMEAASIPFVDQVRAVQNAVLIVAAEGAALSHVMFAQRGATIVNIQPTHDQYGTLPTQCGMSYFWHIAEMVKQDLTYYTFSMRDMTWNSPMRLPLPSWEAFCSSIAETLSRTRGLEL
jgi:capsular polysaccharide biosynthesis protein